MTVNLIAEYERHLSDIGRAASTAQTYLDILRRADRELPAGLAAAHADELRDWIFVDGRGKATRHLYRAAVVSFFAFACNPADPLLDFDPSELLPTVSVPQRAARTIPDEQLRDILLCAGQPYRSWFLLCAFAGLRCIELAALDREDIGADRIWVQGKGDRQRFVPTHPLLAELSRHLPKGPVATDDEGRRLTRQQVSHRGNYHLQRTLGHEGVSMHDLRRFFGTSAYRASGNDIRAVQELLGHSSVSTTQRYVAVASDRMAAAVAGLPDVA